MSYKFENTVGGKLFAKLQQATADCIEYKGKSLAEWEAGQRAEMAIAEAKQAKITREKKLLRGKTFTLLLFETRMFPVIWARNGRSRYDAIGQFVDLANEFDRSEVNIDQDGQYRAQMAFASAAQIDMED